MIWHFLLETIDVDIEEAISTDMSISGNTLSIERIFQSFIFNFENSTKVVNLGKNEIISGGEWYGQYEAYVVQNEMHEIGRFVDNQLYENKVTILKNNVLEFESTQNFERKQLKIKCIYIKDQN